MLKLEPSVLVYFKTESSFINQLIIYNIICRYVSISGVYKVPILRGGEGIIRYFGYLFKFRGKRERKREKGNGVERIRG